MYLHTYLYLHKMCIIYIYIIYIYMYTVCIYIYNYIYIYSNRVEPLRNMLTKGIQRNMATLFTKTWELQHTRLVGEIS